MVKRYELSEEQWRRVAGLLPGKAGDPGRTGADNRLFAERGFVGAALWRTLERSAGAIWQMEIEVLQALHSLWAKAGAWERVFASLTGDPDNQYLMLDTTLVRAHQQAATGKGGTKIRLWGVPEEDVGRPKLRARPRQDAQGHPSFRLRFILTGGEAHAITTAPKLLEDITTAGVIADRAYDSDALRELIAEARAEAVIPSKESSRKISIPH